MANRADRMLQSFQVGFGAGQAIGKRVRENRKEGAIADAYDASKAPEIIPGEDTQQNTMLREQTGGIPTPGEDQATTQAFQADAAQFEATPKTTAFDHYRWAQEQRGKLAKAGVKPDEIDTLIANQNKARLARGAELGELAAQQLEAGDLEGARENLMLSNANYGTGKGITPTIVDGQLYAAFYDEDTGKATTPPIPITPDILRKQMRYLADPMAAAAHDIAINADMRAEEEHDMDQKYADDKNLAGIMKDSAMANHYNQKTALDRVKFEQKMSSGSGKYGWESGEALQKRLGALEDSLYKNVDKGTGSDTFNSLLEAGKAHMVLDHSANILKANPKMNNQQAIDAGTELSALVYGAALPEERGLWKDLWTPEQLKTVEQQAADARGLLASMVDINDKTGIAVLTLPSGKRMIAPPGILKDQGVDYVRMSDYRPFPGGASAQYYTNLASSKGQEQIQVNIPKDSRMYREQVPGSTSVAVGAGAGAGGGNGVTAGKVYPPPIPDPYAEEAPAAPTSPRVPKANPGGAVPENLSVGPRQGIPLAAPVVGSVQQPGSTQQAQQNAMYQVIDQVTARIARGGDPTPQEANYLMNTPGAMRELSPMQQRAVQRAAGQ